MLATLTIALALTSSSQELGEVDFETTCDPAVREHFNRSVALLHSFEYDDARAGFLDVSARDPECAVAYWGVAMSHFHPLWAPPTPDELDQGAQAVGEAARRKKKSARESAYVEAIAEFFGQGQRDTRDYRSKIVAYERAMEALAGAHPEDREASFFYALALLTTARPDDKSFVNQEKAASILEPAFVKYPEHPGLAHYLIHAYDYPELAERGLEAARRYASIAPGSAHARHMPSHIFTRLGLWNEVIASNLDATAAAKAYAERAGIEDAWDEELHGMDYLAYAYLQQARDRDAAAVLDRLRGFQKVYPENFKVAYAFAAIPARNVLERRLWREAVSLARHPDSFPWNAFPWAEAIRHFARALGAVHLGDVPAARMELEVMRQLHDVVDDSYWAEQVGIQSLVVAAWIDHAEGRGGEAVDAMKEAASRERKTEKHPVTPGEILPAQELLGDLLIELGKPEEALAAYRASLERSPGRLLSLYGAGRAAELMGSREIARDYFESLLEGTVSGTEGERPEVAHARLFLAHP